MDVKGRKVPVLSWSELIEMGGSLAEIQQDDLGTMTFVTFHDSFSHLDHLENQFSHHVFHPNSSDSFNESS